MAADAACAEESRINDELAIFSWKHGNVSTRADQDSDVFTQRLNGNVRCLASLARTGHQTFFGTEKALRR